MSEMGYRRKCLAQKINACRVCGDSENLIVHHLDGDEHNNELSNLTPMCRSCHSKLHTTKNPGGVLGELQDKLPDSTLSYTDEPSARDDNGRATARIPVTPQTKNLIDEDKHDGMTYDLYLRELMGVE